MHKEDAIYILIYISCFIVYSSQKSFDRYDCGPLEFDCGNKICIPKAWRCDGDTDCLNGNDEKSCAQKAPTPCDDKIFYQCKESSSQSAFNSTPWRSLERFFPSKCIPKTWRCDGEFDCPLKDDEESCLEVQCGKDQFKCQGYVHHATTCISKSWVCDGQSDCVRSEDEKDCFDRMRNVTCNPDEFRCNNGQCIFKSWQCDGEFDCKDKSDEGEQCMNQFCEPETHFKCAKSDFCLPNIWKCDGHPDCPDLSDERNCTEVRIERPVYCSLDQFKCKNNAECVKNAWVCDGDKDCIDGSDEESCFDSDLKKCGVDETLCSDGLCRLDCDMAFRAPFSSPKCDFTKNYNCSSNICIPLQHLCSDKSSKNDCYHSVCDQQIITCDITDPYCNCRDTYKGGKICSCASGLRNFNGRCIDINECEIPGICDQKCINLIGTYRCDCYPGFKLTGGQPDGEYLLKQPSKCRAIGEDPLLLVSNRYSIRQFNLVNKRYSPLIGRLDSAMSMDYWHQNRTIIWSDVSKKQILGCYMRNLTYVSQCIDQDSFVLLHKDISSPNSLAVDWVHGLLFWTDTGLKTINVYDLVHNRRQVLINISLEEPGAIAVDPTAGLIFWTDWGTQKIERSGMDGKNRVEVISGEAVRWPTGLTVDIFEQQIFWADAKTKAISSCDYWGKNVRTVLKSRKYIKHPMSLAIFEERVFWIDRDHEGVLSANRFNGDDVKTEMPGIPGTRSLRIFHQSLQPKHKNVCERQTCYHFCLPRARITKSNSQNEEPIIGLPYSCGCDVGYILSKFVNECLPHISVNPQNEGHPLYITTTTLQSETEKKTFFDSDFPLYLIGIGFIVIVALLVAYLLFRWKNSPQYTPLTFENPLFPKADEKVADF